MINKFSELIVVKSKVTVIEEHFQISSVSVKGTSEQEY